MIAVEFMIEMVRRNNSVKAHMYFSLSSYLLSDPKYSFWIWQHGGWVSSVKL